MEETMKFAEAGKILECVTGSHAYGFARPDSDMDIRGITIPPLDYIMGMYHFDQQTYPGEDKVIYNLKKFMELAADCNPNIIELLFMPRQHIRFIDKHGEMLLDNRMLFLSKKARFTFSGYAIAQLKRIKRHKRWIDNPPAQPNPEDFVQTVHKVLKEKDGHGMPTRCSQDYWDSFTGPKWTEQGVASEYEAQLKDYEHYLKWKRERNPARAELEEKHGYDTKHAVHLVRLMRMAGEILRRQGVLVDRKEAGDAEELIAIRNGAMTYEALIEWADAEDASMEEAYEQSPLQKAPDRDKINTLFMDIVFERFGIILKPRVYCRVED